MMTPEEKKLLLKDLCSRLPYGVVIQEECIEHDEIFLPNSEDNRLVNIDINEELVITNNNSRYYIEEIKPYLFPLSSMTEEQREKFNSFFASVPYYGDNEHEHVVPYYFVELLNEFFHENHIDNNGLIPMGIALDATGKNIY